MEERIQRAEAAARKAVAAQQAAEEALDKIRMEARDRVSPDEEQQREEQAGATPNDPNQGDSQNGPAPDA